MAAVVRAQSRSLVDCEMAGRDSVSVQARYDLGLERDHLGSALDAITPLAAA
jgi:hypothetical protein